MTEELSVRAATAEDARDVERICLSAFPREEAGTVAELALDLLRHDEDESPGHPCFSLVAERGGRPIGCVAFSSPAWLEDGGGERAFAGSILAPLGVVPEEQGKGVGTALVRWGMELCKQNGDPVVFVYGDPAYYGRFGFEKATAERYPAPHPLSMPQGWQAVRLTDAEPCAEGKLSCVGPLDVPGLW